MNGCIDGWINKSLIYNKKRQRLRIVRKFLRLEFEPATISIRRPLFITLSVWIEGWRWWHYEWKLDLFSKPTLFYNAAHKSATIVFWGEVWGVVVQDVDIKATVLLSWPRKGKGNQQDNAQQRVRDMIDRQFIRTKESRGLAQQNSRMHKEGPPGWNAD